MEEGSSSYINTNHHILIHIHTESDFSEFNLEDHDLSELCGLPENVRCMVTCSVIVYEAGLKDVVISSSDCKAQCEEKQGALCDGDADSGSSTDLASILRESVSGAKTVDEAVDYDDFNIEDHDLSELCNIPENARCVVVCSTIVYEAGMKGMTVSSAECKEQCEAKAEEGCNDEDAEGSSGGSLASLFQSSFGSSAKSVGDNVADKGIYDFYCGH